MKHAVLLALLCLSACDRPASIVASAEAKPEIGRWSITPVVGATSVRESEGRVVSYAWRVDSVTGTVEMCTYSEFPSQTTKGQVIDPTALYCGHEATARAER